MGIETVLIISLVFCGILGSQNVKKPVEKSKTEKTREVSSEQKKTN